MASRPSSKRSIYKGSDTIPLQECDVCRSQDITSEAVSYCTNCDEYLCQRCEQSHKGSRATRDHTLLRGSDLPSGSTRTKPTPDIMLCDKHKTLTLDIYCKTHDDVICTMCKMINHTKCNTVPVSQQTSKLNPDILKKVNKNMSDLTNRVDSLKQARKNDESKTKTQIQKCLKDLQKLRKNINDHFDKLEKGMMDEIKITEEKITKEIHGHITMVDDISQQIEKHKKYLNECQKIQDDEVIFVVVKKVASRLRENEDVISNIEKDVNSIDLHFQPSDAVNDVIQSFESFGTIMGYKQCGNESQTSASNMSVGYKQCGNDSQTSSSNMSVGYKQCGNDSDTSTNMSVGYKQCGNDSDTSTNMSVDYKQCGNDSNTSTSNMSVDYKQCGNDSDTSASNMSVGYKQCGNDSQTSTSNMAVDYKQCGNDSQPSTSNMSVDYKQSNIDNQTSILNMSIVDKQKINVGSCRVLGCTFMCDGHLVLGCYYGLKLFDKHFQYKSELSVRTFDVSSINNTDVITTQWGGGYKLTRIQVLPNMEIKKIIKMDRKCFGVDVFDDKIFVTCHDFPGNGEVRVLNMDGQLQRKLHQHKSRFTQPDYVKVSRDGSKIFISDMNTYIITCLDQQGRVLYEYSDKDLKSPTGMYVDGEDNLLVCGYSSHNVHVVRQNGRKEKILLSSKDGVERPWCISYRHSDDCLVVAHLDIKLEDNKQYIEDNQLHPCDIKNMLRDWGVSRLKNEFGERVFQQTYTPVE